MRLSVLLLLASAAWGAGPTGNAPVYIYLQGRYVDHVHFQWTEKTLAKALEAGAKLRQADPARSAPVVIYMTGAVADMLETRNGPMHQADAIREAQRAGSAEPAYDGAEEPAYRWRPQPDLRTATTPEDRFLARVQAFSSFLNDFKAPISGEPSAGRSGGLRRLQEVFGNATAIMGVSENLGQDTEFVQALKRLNSAAILPGFPASTAWPARNLHGYGGSARGVGTELSPSPNTAPELFFQDGRLRLSQNVGTNVIFQAWKGVKALQTALAALDRSQPHVIQVELAGSDIWMKPDAYAGFSPIRYAYDNPKRPTLPDTMLRTPEEMEAIWKDQDAVVDWLVREFVPANAGSKFVGASTLIKATSNGVGVPVPQPVLDAAAASLLPKWEELRRLAPGFAVADGRYFSLADMFHMLVLAHTARAAGKKDVFLELEPVAGTLETTADDGPFQGEVTGKQIADAGLALLERWRTAGQRELPQTYLPEWVNVGQYRLNSLQYLWLMARAWQSPSPEQRFDIRPCRMHSVPGDVYPRSSPISDDGSWWTLKPAPINFPAPAKPPA